MAQKTSKKLTFLTFVDASFFAYLAAGRGFE